jgi:hypothetical protein
VGSPGFGVGTGVNVSVAVGVWVSVDVGSSGIGVSASEEVGGTPVDWAIAPVDEEKIIMVGVSSD